MGSAADPQAFISSYAPRLRAYANPLFTPVIQPATALAAPLARTTKRGTTAINYAEDGFDEYEEEDDDNRRRPTGLRSLRKEDMSISKQDIADKVGKIASSPVKVSGIWREWMGKMRNTKSELHTCAQASLPLTLVPIRIDLDIPAWVPNAALPFPLSAQNGKPLDYSHPEYKPAEMTVPYRLKDFFLWNLHETLITTDQFAQSLVQDLDLPTRSHFAADISKQIRTQLEEYAGVALHPLFHTQETANEDGVVETSIKPALASQDVSATPATGDDTPMQNGTSQAIGVATTKPELEEITASAVAITPESDDFNPDDTYRCIISLSINLSEFLYTDKFEWSLLHPPGTAEIFAKQTCADIGLPAEWVPAMAHAIYEAVLKLKKDACESGGLVVGFGVDIPNEAAHAAEAGWRYDNEHLALDWEPRIEVLSKDEIEKREGDRERQIRRLRRETARFSTTTMMVGGTPQAETKGYFDPEPAEDRMGRGERNKKKRRFRSLSPLRSGGRGTPDVGAPGYVGSGSLTDFERQSWRCRHCQIWGTSVWGIRDGPHGPKVSLLFH